VDGLSTGHRGVLSAGRLSPDAPMVIGWLVEIEDAGAL
jgi:hypothetical protein